jgi:hypothetical protein
MYEWGVQKTSLFPFYIYSGDYTTTSRPGEVYEAVYHAEGLQTMIPGWEQTAVNDISTQLTQNGCVITYFKADDNVDDITVQFMQSSEASDASSMVLPVIVWYIVASVVFSVLAYWLLTIVAPQSIRVIGSALTDNPIVTYGLGAIIVILLIRELSDLRELQHDDGYIY